jgi:hypothetical protein
MGYHSRVNMKAALKSGKAALHYVGTVVDGFRLAGKTPRSRQIVAIGQTFKSATACTSAGFKKYGKKPVKVEAKKAKAA